MDTTDFNFVISTFNIGTPLPHINVSENHHQQAFLRNSSEKSKVVRMGKKYQ